MATLDRLRKKNAIIRAVKYKRFSSDNQREESIEAQDRAIEEYARRNDIVIVGDYTDRAKSAKTDNRPEFQHMIKDSKQQTFDIVLVHKLDRFARNRADSIGYRAELKRNNVSLISVLEYLDEDSPESLILESVLEAMAEYYSKNLAREVMKGMTENALKGFHTGGIPALGYDINPETKEYVRNEHEATIIKIIFQRTLEGYSYNEIVDELNSNGFRTKKGGLFGKNSLNNILQNEKYVGTLVFNKTPSRDIDGKRNSHKSKDADEIVRIEDAVPQIISKEDFETVQLKLSKRKQTRKHSHSVANYLLTSKMICGICGGAYVGSRRIVRKTEAYYYYGCNARYRKHYADCSNKDIPKDYIEGCILEKLSEYVFGDKYIPKITKEYNLYLKNKNGAYAGQVKALHGKIKRLDSDIEKLVVLLMKTSSQVLIDKLAASEHQKAVLETELKTLESDNRQSVFTEDDIRKVFTKIRAMLSNGTLHNVKQVIETYVDKITVYPDEVKVQLNFFPDFSLKLEEKEKDCPITECVSDIQGQSHSCTISKNADDFGAGGLVPRSSAQLNLLVFWVERKPPKDLVFNRAKRILNAVNNY